jgi:transporter family-2 protein
MTWVLLLVAICAGAALAVQSGVNSVLASHIGHPLQATLVSFAVGGCAVFAITMMARLPWPALSEIRQAPVWAFAGGLLGVFYLTASVVLAPRLGASAMVGAVIAGQLLTSLLLDHFGVIGFPIHPLNAPRVLGVLLLIGGVLLIRNF